MEGFPDSGFQPTDYTSLPLPEGLDDNVNAATSEANNVHDSGNVMEPAIGGTELGGYSSYLNFLQAATDVSGTGLDLNLDLDMNLDLDLDPGYLGLVSSDSASLAAGVPTPSLSQSSLSLSPFQQPFSAFPQEPTPASTAALQPPGPIPSIPPAISPPAQLPPSTAPNLPLQLTKTAARQQPLAPAAAVTVPIHAARPSLETASYGWASDPGSWELPSASSQQLPPTNITTATTATTAAGGEVVPAKPRLERRGHTKSRRGCFNCKRRRIKCQETRPACGHCIKQGLRCEYPTMPTIVHQPQHQIPLFTLQDMRLLHHFLTECYPHHPIGSEELWLHEIPCLAERHAFLMHAILGYSASELMSNDPSLKQAAFSHRAKALKAMQKALDGPSPSIIRDHVTSKTVTANTSPSPNDNNNNTPSSSSSSPSDTGTTDKKGTPNPPTPPPASPPPPPPGTPPTPPPPPTGTTTPLYTEGNAMMAACIALAYQAPRLPDGMAQYMTFIRGVIIVAIQMYIHDAKILFGPLMMNDRQREIVRPFMQEVPLIDAGWRERARKGVEGLKGLVMMGEKGATEVERGYWERLSGIVKGLGVGSWEAYSALTDLYAWWMVLSHDEFRRLVDQKNQIALVLGAHWNALEQIMATICETELKGAAKLPSGSGSSAAEVEKRKAAVATSSNGWLKYILGIVKDEYREYLEFPMWVQARLDEDPGFFGKTWF